MQVELELSAGRDRPARYRETNLLISIHLMFGDIYLALVYERVVPFLPCADTDDVFPTGQMKMAPSPCVPVAAVL